MNAAVPRTGRRRLPADPGRGAAAPQPRPASREHGRRSRVPDRGLQSPAQQRERRDLGAYLLGQSQPAARALESAELRARACPHSAAARLRCPDHSNCASSDGQDLPLFKHIRTDKKIAIGGGQPLQTRWWNRPSMWRPLIRKAREYIPKESSWSSAPTAASGREGPVASHRLLQVRGLWSRAPHRPAANSGLPEARVRAADPNSCGSRGVDAVAPPPRAKLGKVSPFRGSGGVMIP